MMRAIVFVDANNWYHNIKGWFKPSDIDIVKVADLISKEKKVEIKEIRWYVSMPSMEDNELVYKGQRSFLGHLQKQGIVIITRKLQRLSNKEIKRKRQELLDSWDLCNVCRPIVESSFLDIKDPNQKEKGIDVRIAIDMVNVALQDNFDYLILVSGDADFVPALELVKKVGKEILSTSVPRGYSNELRQKIPYFILKREDLSKCLKKYETSRNKEVKK